MTKKEVTKNPLAKIPKHERWLHENPETLKRVQHGLKQKGKHYLGSFKNDK